MEVWTRPWCLMQGLNSTQRLKSHQDAASQAVVRIGDHLTDPIYVYSRSSETPRVDHHAGHTVAHAVFNTTDGATQTLWHIARPLRISKPSNVTRAATGLLIDWHGFPNRPLKDQDGNLEEERIGSDLMQRIQSIWARLKDVKESLAHPIDLWPSVAARWMQEDEARRPEMDVIVRHARELSRDIDAIQKSPRRILKRVQKSLPLSRVQEVDRRSLLSLTKQPGNTIAERAGPSQRILAIAREESFDTLENRVLRSYCDLARKTAKDYVARNKWARQSNRVQLVRSFNTKSRHVGRSLAESNVRITAPGVVPNFVLQNNSHYHAIWNGWQELLQKEKIKDELWRWQARSWEEFCAVATIVALQRIEGARLIAAAPVTFMDEQQCGQWLQHDNPLAVFLLEKQDVVVEVQYRFRISARLAQFGAPIWLRIGHLQNWQTVQRRVPVWPLHAVIGGLRANDAEQIADIVERHGRADNLVGGVVLRFGSSDLPETEYAEKSKVRTMASTLGVESQSLKAGMETYSAFLSSFV